MGKRLLVVDSDRRFIQDHRAQLEAAFEVDFLYATDGALSKLESGEYGALLLCVETSENKGYALCLAIRRTPPPGDLRIALISAKASEEEYARHRQTKGRADVYLHKPIASGALISALADLVPMREPDPDNPLGDLAGVDLGDEWLESLRNELELTTAPPAPAPEPPPVSAAQLIAPAQGWSAPVPSARNEGEVELLIWRVKDLEQKLAGHFDELARKDQEIADLQAAGAMATRNLDEAQSGLQEAEALRTRLEVLEQDSGRLRDDLQDALDEQKRLTELLDEAQAALADRTQSMEALQELHDGLQERLRDLEEACGLAQVRLEEATAEAGRAGGLEAALADAESRARAQEELAAELRRQVEELGARVEAESARAEAEAAQVRELEPLPERVRALEAELASAQDQVSFQELTLRNHADERDRLQEERDRHEEAAQELGAEAILLRERVAHLEGAAQEGAEELERLRELRGTLESALANLEAQLEASESARESQRGELMEALGSRDAQLGALGAEAQALRDRITALEGEKAGLEALVKGREDRLETITTVLTELEAKARQAMDLARSVSR